MECTMLGGLGLRLLFGDANLFDLEEIEVAIDLPIIETFTISVSCQFLMSGTHTIALGWELSI